MIQRSIKLRNPYVDPLNYLQVEMLRRIRALPDLATVAEQGVAGYEIFTGKGRCSTCHAGGILAGITNGAEIVIRAACKPIPSIARPQETVDLHGNPAVVTIGGRHDVSVIPRIIPVCEAMVCIVLADHLLRQRAIGK